MELKNVTKDFINNTGIFMQKGFYGNKTEMIDKAAQDYANRLDCVDIWAIQECIDRIIQYSRDKDTYNEDRWRANLNYVVERAAKEGVK